MSTAVLGMHSVGPQHRDIELHFDLMSKNASTYDTAHQWAPSPQDDRTYMSMPDYTGFPMSDTQQSDTPFSLHSNYGQSNSGNHDVNKTQPDQNAHLRINTTGFQSAPAMFTTSNSQMDSHGPATVSPLDTRFDVDYASPGSDAKSPFGSQMSNMPSSNYATYANHIDPSSSKRRCDSLQSTFEPQSSQATVGRRRGSEYAEPGSARAIYLEKNRKAASKCRSKQKRQQEELVETARDVERRNKILKAELELLKSDMHHLMELVGQHSSCPDARLRLYVQREADRLATGGNSLSSPFSRGSISGPSSVDKASSPEDD